MSKENKNVKFRNVIVDWSRISDEGLPYCVIQKEDDSSKDEVESQINNLLVDSIALWGEKDQDFFLDKFDSDYFVDGKNIIAHAGEDEAYQNGAKIIYALLRNSGADKKTSEKLMTEYFNRPDINTLKENEIQSAWIEWNEVKD